MTKERFAYIWRYTINPDCRSEFFAAYNPSGEWAQLFSRDPAYQETVFLSDDRHENRFVTIDFWNSKADRDAFQKKYSAEFAALDDKCETFTTDEENLGDFLEIGAR